MSKQQALTKVQRNSELAQAYRLEKAQLEAIIDKALNHTDPGQHWFAYSVLKEQASKFVGWDAPRQELRSNAHYEVMVDFIDWLLSLAEKSGSNGPSRMIDEAV
jgi:hypothetical protein